jgi:hypothetical protein
MMLQLAASVQSTYLWELDATSIHGCEDHVSMRWICLASLLQGNLAAIAANAAGKEYMGEGEQPVRDPETVCFRGDNASAVGSSVLADVCAEACNVCDEHVLLCIFEQVWINGMLMAGLMRFIVRCEPQVSMYSS